MARITNLENNSTAVLSDERMAEINYHRKLNRRFVFAAFPSFVFFAVFHFAKGNLLPSLIFTLLAINAVVTFGLSLYIKKLDNLILLKRVGSAIAFTLLAFILVCGLLSKGIYMVFPWMFIYPVAVLLMFGERIGIFFAWGYCTLICVSLFIVDLPPWDIEAVKAFKFSSAFALISSLILARVAERTRVRMQNELLEARNKYMAAEESQRFTNEKLKNEIEMRIKSENLLSQSETRYRALFEESAVSLWEENYADVKTFLNRLSKEAMDDMKLYFRQHSDELEECLGKIQITAVNRATLNLYEAADMQELLANMSKILPKAKLIWSLERISALYREGRYQNLVEAQTIKGRKLNLLVTSTVPAEYRTSWEKVYTSINDITERAAIEEEKKQVEKQAQHTRQIQAIATLAGGIAHQFNNALTVIVGNLDLLALKLLGNPETESLIENLNHSSENMHRLTNQLLAYAKGGKYRPTDFPVDKIIIEYLKSNQYLRESGVRFTTRFEEDVILCRSDITQITSVLEAVLFNAVEAMGNSGEVTISTQNLIIDKTHKIIRKGLTPGGYALITIEDHGVGMNEETCRRIFDPFFSTKFVGRGMGMAAAYGIVCNHNGMIDVSSEPGQGTHVMIYLPNIHRTDHF